MYMNLNKSVRKIEKYFGNISKCYQLNMNVNVVNEESRLHNSTIYITANAR